MIPTRSMYMNESHQGGQDRYDIHQVTQKNLSITVHGFTVQRFRVQSSNVKAVKVFDFECNA